MYHTMQFAQSQLADNTLIDQSGISLQQAAAYNERGIPHINDLANSKLSNFNNETEQRKNVIFYNEKASARGSSNHVTNNGSQVITPNLDLPGAPDFMTMMDKANQQWQPTYGYAS